MAEAVRDLEHARELARATLECLRKQIADQDHDDLCNCPLCGAKHIASRLVDHLESFR